MRIGRISIRDHYLIVGAQAAGQLALLAVIPVLARAFTPAELGPYQIAMAIALVLQPFATLRYEWVIPVAKSVKLAKQYVRRSRLAIVITNSAILGLALLATLGHRDGVSLILLMTSFICLAYSFMSTDNAVLIRSQHLKRLALRNLISGVSAAILQLLVALFAPYAVLVAAAVLVGRLFAVGVTSTRSSGVRAVGDGTDSVRYGLRAMSVNVASGVVVSAALQSLTLTAGWLLGSAQAAFVATAQRVSGTPAAVLGQGIGQAVQASAAKTVTASAPSGSLTQSMWRAAVRVALFAVFIGVGMALLGPVLAVPILGDQWAVVGTILPIMALPIALQLIVNPLTPVLAMIGSERTVLILSLIRLAVTIGAAASVAATTGDLIATVAAFSISTVLCYVLYLIAIVLCVRRFDEGRRAAAASSSA